MAVNETLIEYCREVLGGSNEGTAVELLHPHHIHTPPSAVVVWGAGLFFVTLINMCAISGIAVMRFLSQAAYNQVITLFVGLGVGSLSGSSFYHLLPQSNPQLLEGKAGEEHSYLHMAHFSLLGIYAFFMTDKIIKIVLEYRKRKERVRSHTHDHAAEGGDLSSNRSGAPLLNGGKCNDAVVPQLTGHFDTSRTDIEMSQMQKLEDVAQTSMGDQAHSLCVHDHSLEFHAGDSAIAAVAWMIIFGDGFHNFIDGISIGASFAESTTSGISISLAVLCEEFPHELGDVAILVASGMTLRQALLYNLLSAITCYIGFFVGVCIGELGPDTAKYCFALAGGMFLYISLGCMLPEMRKAVEEALNVSIRRGVYVLLLQTIGLLLGLNLMYYMSKYGETMFA